jgi:hypothetical protein
VIPGEIICTTCPNPAGEGVPYWQLSGNMTSPHLTSPKCRGEVGEARVGRLISHSGLTVISDEMICTTWQNPAGGVVPYWQETQSNLTVPFQGRSTTHGGHLTPSTGVEAVMPGYSGVESFPLMSNFSWGHVSTY